MTKRRGKGDGSPALFHSAAFRVAHPADFRGGQQLVGVDMVARELFTSVWSQEASSDFPARVFSALKRPFRKSSVRKLVWLWQI